MALWNQALPWKTFSRALRAPGLAIGHLLRRHHQGRGTDLSAERGGRLLLAGLRQALSLRAARDRRGRPERSRAALLRRAGCQGRASAHRQRPGGNLRELCENILTRVWFAGLASHATYSG